MTKQQDMNPIFHPPRSDARGGGEAAQGVEAEGWRVHLFRGQWGCDRQQQGRDEG